MTAPFVHLRVHSHFSLLRSAIDLEDLCRRTAEGGAPAVALTDDGNLFGAVEFAKAANDSGLAGIQGCDLFVARGSRHDKPEGARDATSRLVVLCESERGWSNLVQLSSGGYVDGLHDGSIPRVDDELIARHSAGLVALEGGLDSEVGVLFRAGRLDEAVARASWLRDAFGAERLFLRLEDHGQPLERDLNAFLVELAPRLGVDVVATNDCRFLDPGHLEAYRALYCIGTGTTLDDPLGQVLNEGHALRSAEEMAATFAQHPRAITNTLAIAERCAFRLPTNADPQLPAFDVPPGETLDSWLRQVVVRGMDERRRERLARRGGSETSRSAKAAAPDAEYDARLEMELEVIARMGFPGYFLVVWDLIRHAREQGIPVGPGRGSAAGSIVAYALRITDLDPLEWGLLFERFLNPGRRSLPDIDMDFCQRRRGEVIRYVQQKYGEDHVAQIITFGTLNARSVLRDVGRVMNMTYGEVDRIAKLVPEELGVTLEKALEASTQLDDLVRTDPRVGRLMDTARQLEGLARNAGVHAAGVVIAPRPLRELVPLFKTGRNEVTTQFAMGGVEAVGLVKMDFLGLKTLTVLDDAVKSIARAGGPTLRLDALPLDDGPTFQLFKQARTSGIFQFESSGMRDILRRLGPEELEDLVALNALYRPGPMQFIDSFIARRRGREKVTYPHAALEQILAPTMGIMVYQEQVMQASRQLAGFTQAEADDLRKAMGKKKPEVMAAQKEKFVQGAKATGVRPEAANQIFDAIEGFARYAFNRAHSACYALVAYWTGWLKANHPAHFMASLLTSERDNTAKVVRYIAECKEMGLEVLPPDVNESDVEFTVVPGEGPAAAGLPHEGPAAERIRFGLSAIKGVGRGAVASILDARARRGRFTDLHAFCAEIDLRLANRKVLEALVKAGALDGLGAGRSTLMFSLDAACELAATVRLDRETGQGSLFGASGGPSEPSDGAAAPAKLPAMPEWTRKERLRHEKEVLGFYVSGHPLQEHADLVATLGTTQVADLAEKGGQEVSIAGVVTSVRRTRTKKGDWMGFVMLEDLTGTCEIVIFPNAWKEAEAHVAEDAALFVKGTAEVDGDRGKLLAEEVRPLGAAQQAAASGVLVRLPPGKSRQEMDDLLDRVDEALSRWPGACPVRFEVAVADVGTVVLQAASRFNVDPVPEIVGRLEQLVGPTSVQVTYGGSRPGDGGARPGDGGARPGDGGARAGAVHVAGTVS